MKSNSIFKGHLITHLGVLHLFIAPNINSTLGYYYEHDSWKVIDSGLSTEMTEFDDSNCKWIGCSIAKKFEELPIVM